MASEIDALNHRMSRIEAILNKIMPHESFEVPDSTVATEPTCETCGSRLSHPESNLHACRSCRTENVSKLMQSKDSPALSSSVSKRDRLERIKEALDTIELLALAKQYYTYDDLAKILRLPSTVLSRYVKGHVLPSGKRVRQIRAELMEAVKLGAHIADSLKEVGVGVFPQIDMNPRLLWFIVQYIVHANAGRRITKVLTASEHGVPLATLVSHRLDVPLIVATSHKRAGIQKYLESAVLSTTPPSTQPYISTMYLPSHALKKNDAVLIITDFLSDGAIQATLERLVQNAKATIAAVWATIVTADDWQKIGPIDFLVKTNVPSTSHAEGDEKFPSEPIAVPSQTSAAF